jgi:hypothetical protein
MICTNAIIGLFWLILALFRQIRPFFGQFCMFFDRPHFHFFDDFRRRILVMRTSKSVIFPGSGIFLPGKAEISRPEGSWSAFFAPPSPGAGRVGSGFREHGLRSARAGWSAPPRGVGPLLYYIIGYIAGRARRCRQKRVGPRKFSRFFGQNFLENDDP